MKGKYKTTGCARFFFALIILAPLAYIGASYYNGQNGIENLKNLVGLNKARADVNDDGGTYDLQQEIAQLQKEIKALMNKCQ